ncbi:hypothetical protein F511_44001 [Dorcoceras hygrometricum]|uniref:Aminotransferase-like plant mobile domain-containing protein n=1 Tax=Dorcoceras hygrometricum TaxID=472368 RepID=A0A2Z7C2Q2_9LAMI|nr:hypothetical protein F511_44001 [Dorcoceras hygrometricum]
MKTEAEAVDDVHAKIGKQFYSRCSPTYFSNVMSELKPILGEQQRMRISDSLFCKWIDMPVLAISSGRLDYFLNRFDVPSCSFLINDDAMIPFRSSEFSIVLGLQHSGQPVDLDLKMESRFLARHFASKVTKTDRAAIHERMMLLAGSSEENEVDDFFRFFILFIFNCIIFSTFSYVTPGFIFPYLDDLTTFLNHAWGDAEFLFLYREICHLGSKMYVDGCVVGLMALVYESIPTLGVRRSLKLYPRLFRWGKSRIPLKSDEADTLLNSVDITQALVYESIPTLGVRRSLKLYPRLFRWGKSRIPLKSDEADTLLNSVDITQVLPIQHFNEEENLVDLKRVERSEDGMSEVLPIRPFNKEENLVSEYGIPEVRRLEKIVIRQSEKIKLLEKRCAELEDQNLRHELNVAEAVVEKGEKSGEGAELDEASKDGNEANKDVEGSELSLSKLNEITVFQSSIVDNVRTRADRVKKRKGSMFVTPPSSTPRQKTRVKKQAFVDVDEAINSLGERGIDEFRGRADFIGHEKSSDEDRKLVMEFLGKDKLDVIVWEDEHMSLSGHALCTLLFHEPVESEIINVYMRIMRQQSLLNGSEIFCMDTNVQREILEHLEKFGKRRKIQNSEYEAFASRLSSFTRSKLMELNEEIFSRCREEGIFKLWNSKHDAFAVGTAKVYIRFLAGFLRHLSRFEIASQDLVRERCRQQGPTLNMEFIRACGCTALLMTPRKSGNANRRLMLMPIESALQARF